MIIKVMYKCFLLHAGIGSDDIGDWSPADGALESLSLELQPTLHTDTHVPTPVTRQR